MFLFNETSTTQIYTLSLHDALPISHIGSADDRDYREAVHIGAILGFCSRAANGPSYRVLRDRKSTRLNSSHANTSYAVFCLQIKNTYLHLRHLTLFSAHFFFTATFV